MNYSNSQLTFYHPILLLNRRFMIFIAYSYLLNYEKQNIQLYIGSDHGLINSFYL